MKIKPKFASLLVILCGLLASTAAAAPPLEGNAALLYAVDELANLRGAISVYDIAAEHRLIKTIRTVPNVGDVKGVAASTVTGKALRRLYRCCGNRDGLLPEHLRRHHPLEHTDQSRRRSAG